jgi:hypothetical protein
MKEQFITYKIALELKKLGFNENTRFGIETALYDEKGEFLFYCNFGVMGSGLTNKYIKAYLWQQVIDWFREEKEIIVSYDCMYVSGIINPYWHIFMKTGEVYSNFTNTIEEAREQAIHKALKLIK